MKLKEFNIDNTISNRTSSPQFSISKGGLFSLSIAACELISITGGDQIVFLQDEEEPENWYLEKVVKSGFIVRECKTSSRGLLFNNVSLARKIMDEMDLNGDAKSYRFLVAGKPTEFQKRKLFGILKINAE